jgi:hypothetical protein
MSDFDSHLSGLYILDPSFASWVLFRDTFAFLNSWRLGSGLFYQAMNLLYGFFPAFNSPIFHCQSLLAR